MVYLHGRNRSDSHALNLYGFLFVALEICSSSRPHVAHQGGSTAADVAQASLPILSTDLESMISERSSIQLQSRSSRSPSRGIPSGGVRDPLVQIQVDLLLRDHRLR